jgi:hypothetical protein
VPNVRNVEAPINLHGVGRSGTTLLQNLLGATGDVQICNELASLVFCTYRGAEVALTSDDRDISAADAGPGAAVHAALCAIMPSDKTHWCQKLGGLPKDICWTMTDCDDRAYASEPFPFPYRWFWKVLATSFPSSKDVLILRDYRDIIVSRHLHSGWHPDDIAADVAIYLNIMAHRAAKIDCVIKYEDLVSAPDETIHRLVSCLGLTGGETAMRAMAWHASPSSGEDLAAARSRGFSWRTKYDSLISDRVRSVVTPAIRRLEHQLKIELDDP